MVSFPIDAPLAWRGWQMKRHNLNIPFNLLLLAVLLLTLLVAMLVPGYGATRRQHLPSQHTGAAYAMYCNVRFGFTVQYPRSCKKDPPPENGDGQIFRAADGFEMVASGRWNASDDTVASLIAIVKTDFDHITYKSIGRNRFVLSGIKGSTIVYEKMFVGKETIYTLKITYPVTRKAKYGKIVAHISSSFKPGEPGKHG